MGREPTPELVEETCYRWQLVMCVDPRQRFGFAAEDCPHCKHRCSSGDCIAGDCPLSGYTKNKNLDLAGGSYLAVASRSLRWLCPCGLGHLLRASIAVIRSELTGLVPF